MRKTKPNAAARALVQPGRLDAAQAVGGADTGLSGPHDDIIQAVRHAVAVPQARLCPAASDWTRISEAVLAVADATREPGIAALPDVRAFLAAPVRSSTGEMLGALCAIDIRPRRWSSRHIAQMEVLARLAAVQIETAAKLEQASRQVERLATLSADEVRNRTIISSMWEGMFVQRWDGMIVSANPSALRILDRTHDELVGRKTTDTCWKPLTEDGAPFPIEAYPAMVALRTGEAVTDVTMSFVVRGGDRRWILINARPLVAGGPIETREVVCTFADITARREQEARLSEARLAAEEASLAKSAFLANMSHELRTPLNGVIGIAGALGRTKTLDANQTEMVRLIETSGQALERLLSDVLDISKVETGKLDLEIRAFDLRAEIDAAAQVMGIRASEKGVDFLVQFGDQANGWFEADALRIRQIVSNFASNAVKFTAKGRVTIKVDFKPDEAEPGVGQLLVDVEDSGIGFDQAAADQIFERFVQADVSISRRYGGTGLGLSICRALAELMGGSVHATSTPGVGSIFHLSLPLRRATAEAAAAAQDHEPEVEFFADAGEAKLRILMAEDHPTNQRVVQLILEPYGVDLTIVDNGQCAIDAWRLQAFDLILMDMQMPGMDGLTATREIRRLEAARGGPRIPIAMLTANTGEAHRHQALAAGADSHIGKPVTPDSLLSGIEALMAEPAYQTGAVG